MSGELKAGEAIPSVRSLAKSLHISILTVQKAYTTLQEDGFIETTAGKGCYVSAQNQATDRAYRIGQKSNVQVFNLVMKDSVEEKIIEMQKRKKELADMFVENNSGGLSQMSKEDILSLFTM